MSDSPAKLGRWIPSIRWAARILSLMLWGLIFTFIIGEGSSLVGIFRAEPLLTTCLSITLVGLIVGWKREGLGGLMIMDGMALFYLANFLSSGRFPGGWVFPIFYLPGVLFLLCWWRTREELQ